jgi:thymidine phosphorylase
MACHIHGLSDTEIELLMRAMMFSGELLVWPVQWHGKMASLQSLGSAGNKAKLVLAPVMAACGLKVRTRVLIS